MIFITGPLYSGKRTYACSLLGCGREDLQNYALWDVQDLVREERDLDELAKSICHREILIATEIGGGVVPLDPEERAWRERAGRLSCLLAQRADKVIRVFCGLPLVLKGGEG